MPTFIQVDSSDRKRLFDNLKNNLSWEKIYPQLGIRRSMFFHYLSGRYPIPEKTFFRLEEISKTHVVKIKKVERVRYSLKEIKDFKLDTDLSEILGVLNGDGHLDPINYEICVVGNSLEKDYCSHLKILFEKKFGMDFKTLFPANCFKLRVYSKKLIGQLSAVYNLPLGNKMGKLKIPSQVKENLEFLRAYIRGLYDTDGCFHIRRKKDPMVIITSADEKFLSEVKTALVSLGFHPSNGNRRIFIYRPREVVRFFDEIKPANHKHLNKYQKYLNLSAGGLTV